MEIKRKKTVFFVEKQSEALSIPLTTYPRGYFAENFFRKSSFFHHWALSDFFLSFLRKFVGPLVSTVFCLSNGPVCGEKTFVQKFFPHHFWTLIAKWSSFVRIFFGQVDDTAFYGSKGSIWGLKAFLTKFCLIYLSFADLEPNNHGFFPENNRQGCQNCSPRVQGCILQGDFFQRIFFRKSSFSISALGIERIFSVISTEICRSRCQYCFLFVNMTSLWWKNFCQKIFFTTFLDIHPKIISLRSNFFSAKLTTLLSTSPKDQFEDITSFWQSFCLFFQWFLESERRNNGFFSSKNNRQICHNCLPRVQEDFVKIFFWKVLFFIIGHWATSVCHFDKNLSVRCQCCFLFVNLASL